MNNMNYLEPKFYKIEENKVEYHHLVNILKDVISAYLQLINLTPEDCRGSVLFDKWSLKDVLAHFCGWNELTIRDIERTLNGQELVWIDGDEIDEFNANSVLIRQNDEWESVYREFKTNLDILLYTYEKLTPEEQELMMFDISLRESVVIDINHYIYHFKELRSLLDTIEN